MNRRRFLMLSAAMACAPHHARAATWRGRALGAEVSLTLTGTRAETQSAIAAIPERLNQIEALFSLYRSDSQLSILNQTGTITSPALFTELTDIATTAWHLSGGLFDPTVQALWTALATGQNQTKAQASIGWHRLRRSGTQITLAPGQQLTFNGIAQGFATDLIRNDLRARGFDHALINIGEHAAIGGPFTLGLADPSAGIIGQKTLTNTALATSSPDAMSLGNAPHILGPQGQRPRWSTVSIEAPSAALADALSTAAVFMDVPQLKALKRNAGLIRITLIDTDGNLTTL